MITNSRHNRKLSFLTHELRRRRSLSTSVSKCPYEVLGVDREATLAEVKKAYFARALLYHPDTSKVPEDNEKWSELSKAYESVLPRVTARDGSTVRSRNGAREPKVKRWADGNRYSERPVSRQRHPDETAGRSSDWYKHVIQNKEAFFRAHQAAIEKAEAYERSRIERNSTPQKVVLHEEKAWKTDQNETYTEVLTQLSKKVDGVIVTTENLAVTLPDGTLERDLIESWFAGGRLRERPLEYGLSRRTTLLRLLFGSEKPLAGQDRREAIQEFGLERVLRREWVKFKQKMWQTIIDLTKNTSPAIENNRSSKENR